MLQQRIDQIDSGFHPTPDQRRMGRRSIQVSSLFGPVRVERDYDLGTQGAIARPMPLWGWREVQPRRWRRPGPPFPFSM